MHVTCVSSVLMALLSLFMIGCASLDPRPSVSVGQHQQSFQKEITKMVRAEYLLYIPEEYNTTEKKWPLILFLHGAGERGNDVHMVAAHGPPKLVEQGKAFPFVIVSPQCPENSWWSSELQMDRLNALLDDIVSRYRIDQERIYVTGLSMGGFGTWRLAHDYPHRFAAIAPVCGKGDPESVQNIRHLPAWVFHGAKDSVIPIKESQLMVDALTTIGGNVQFTVYPEAGHDSWTETYNNPELYEWFLKHTRSEHEQTVTGSTPPKKDAGDGWDPVFTQLSSASK